MAKILVVDDDGIVRDALSLFLTRAGHQVLTAADGGNGVLVFKSNLPDLVILDRDLPVMSGSGVFDSIHKISPATPVIIVTGYDSPEEADAYLRCGAAGFLSKGEGLARVLDEVDRVLGVEPGRGPGCAAGGKRPLVLVVDDEASLRAILRRFLDGIGCDSIEAADGLKAVSLARARRPDLVLLDISMPEKTGVEVLRELAPEMPETGFMMITGNEDEELARDCLGLGAFDYASKPLNLDTLRDTIKARLLLQGK